VGVLTRAALLLAALTGSTLAAELPTVVFATSDPAISVSSAPYTSLQITAGLVRREAHVNLKIQAVAGATAAAQAISAGNAFYNWGSMTSLIYTAQKDPSLVIISFDPGNSFRLVVPDGSPVHDAAALKGKTIGIQSYASGAYLYARAVLAQAGLNPQTDVRWLPIGVGAQAASALHSGQVAGYAGYDSPNAVIAALLKEPMREIASPLNDLNGMSGIVVRRDSVEKQPELVAGLCRAFYESLVFAQANPRATVLNHWRLYPDQKPSNVPEAQALTDAIAMLNNRLVGIARPGPEGLFGSIPLAEMQKTADELLAAGMLQTRADMAKLSDLRFKERCGRLDVAALTTEAKAWQPPQ
jgi:NitT/TauT family transport system substrate-binding protein